MDLSASGLLELATQNRAWAPLAAFVFGMADATAVVSLILPATPLLIGLGALVAQGAISFWPVWLGATAGAVAGSTLSWWVGHHFGRAVLGHPPFDHHQELSRRSLNALQRWGPWAVFGAYVFPPLTSVMFLVAGVVGIPFWRFQRFNVPGAALSAWFLPATGQLGVYLWTQLRLLLSGP